MYKNKVIKILFGFFVFMVASVNVSAISVSLYIKDSKTVILEGKAGVNTCFIKNSSSKYSRMKCTNKSTSKQSDVYFTKETPSNTTNVCGGGKFNEVKSTIDISKINLTSGQYSCYAEVYEDAPFMGKRWNSEKGNGASINLVIDKTFKVTLDPNGGTVSKTKFECNSGNCSFDIPDASKSGAEFLGWSTDSCKNIAIQPGKGRGINYQKTTTYIACWDKKTCRELSTSSCSGKTDGYGNSCGLTSDNKCAYVSCSSHTQSTCGYYKIASGKNCEWKNNSCVQKVSTGGGSGSGGSGSGVTSNETKEYIRGYRYLQSGYEVEGEKHLSTIQCGVAVYIEYCDKVNNQNYCYYYNNETGTYVKVNRNSLANSSEVAATSCGNIEVNEDTQEKMYYTGLDDEIACGDLLSLTKCNGSSCIYTNSKGEDVTISYNYLNKDKSTAQKICDDRLNDNKCDNENITNRKGTHSYTVCFDVDASERKIKRIIEEHYKCAIGYEFDETSVYSNSRKVCNDKTCSQTYEVTCARSEGEYKPTLEVSSGSIGSDGRTGIITVRAKSTEGRIMQYYASPIYKIPTDTTTGWINVNSDTFTISATPGIQYIWVKDTKGNISHGIGGAVFDTVNADTTINMLKITDSNDELQSPMGNTAYKVEGITNSTYVRLSNNLVKDSVIAENGFNPYAMEYKIEVDTPTISVYATLTSTDSNYVSGYEPRTVNLDYGMNTVLIKIQNKEGKVRTYTILVNRVDDRTADNTLSDLSIDVGKIDFNSNKTEYKIEIPANTEKVNVNATIGSDRATFVDGYKPGVVNIKGDTTTSFIKVKSETGSTRTYVLTFIKEKTDIINKKNLMLFDLVIPGVYVAFEEEIANYNISVAYETEIINLMYDLKDKDSTATVYFKGKNDNEYRLSSNQGIKLDVGENFIEIKIVNKDGEESFYRLTIIRKEFGLGISNDTTLRDLSVLGDGTEYEIEYEPNKKEYTVRIKQEKSLVITAIPNDNRAEVFIRGNDELTGFSTVRVKVIAENGEFDTYSIDIKKDAFNKNIEIAAIIAGVVIILGSSCIIVIKNKNKKNREYYEE